MAIDRRRTATVRDLAVSEVSIDWMNIGNGEMAERSQGVERCADDSSLSAQLS